MAREDTVSGAARERLSRRGIDNELIDLLLRVRRSPDRIIQYDQRRRAQTLRVLGRLKSQRAESMRDAKYLRMGGGISRLAANSIESMIGFFDEAIALLDLEHPKRRRGAQPDFHMHALLNELARLAIARRELPLRSVPSVATDVLLVGGVEVPRERLLDTVRKSWRRIRVDVIRFYKT